MIMQLVVSLSLKHEYYVRYGEFDVVVAAVVSLLVAQCK